MKIHHCLPAGSNYISINNRWSSALHWLKGVVSRWWRHRSRFGSANTSAVALASSRSPQPNLDHFTFHTTTTNHSRTATEISQVVDSSRSFDRVCTRICVLCAPVPVSSRHHRSPNGPSVPFPLKRPMSGQTSYQPCPGLSTLDLGV
jgi:hypothetical protein